MVSDIIIVFVHLSQSQPLEAKIQTLSLSDWLEHPIIAQITILPH